MLGNKTDPPFTSSPTTPLKDPHRNRNPGVEEIHHQLEEEQEAQDVCQEVP